MARLITIIGGGLAGLSLGIGLRKAGVPVDLHEAGEYPRHRVCGEFISGVSNETLDSLGIGEPLRETQTLSTTCWYRQGESVHNYNLPSPAKGISRYQLDRALSEIFVTAGGNLHCRSRQEFEPREGVVRATGRLPKKGKWVGLKCHLKNFPLEADLEMHMGRNGYAGLCRVENGEVNLCGLFRTPVSKSGGPQGIWENTLKAGGFENLLRRVQAASIREDSFCAVAGFHLGWQVEQPGALTVGDSSVMIPPFTGNGMSMAFQSAECALPFLVDYAEGRISWPEALRSTQEALRNRFTRRMITARIAHPFLTHPAGQALLCGAVRTGMLPIEILYRLLR